jgi:hypothetical protein
MQNQIKEPTAAGEQTFSPTAIKPATRSRPRQIMSIHQLNQQQPTTQSSSIGGSSKRVSWKVTDWDAMMEMRSSQNASLKSSQSSMYHILDYGEEDECYCDNPPRTTKRKSMQDAMKHDEKAFEVSLALLNLSLPLENNNVNKEYNTISSEEDAPRKGGGGDRFCGGGLIPSNVSTLSVSES